MLGNLPSSFLCQISAGSSGLFMTTRWLRSTDSLRSEAKNEKHNQCLLSEQRTFEGSVEDDREDWLLTSLSILFCLLHLTSISVPCNFFSEHSRNQTAVFFIPGLNISPGQTEFMWFWFSPSVTVSQKVKVKGFTSVLLLTILRSKCCWEWCQPEKYQHWVTGLLVMVQTLDLDLVFGTKREESSFNLWPTGTWHIFCVVLLCF